jgi:hypothetical protein
MLKKMSAADHSAVITTDPAADKIHALDAVNLGLAIISP